MADKVSREPARDPQDLERLLVSRQRAGDVDGMAALYEPHAVLDCGGVLPRPCENLRLQSARNHRIAQRGKSMAHRARASFLPY
jgi:hypothetical protein